MGWGWQEERWGGRRGDRAGQELCLRAGADVVLGSPSLPSPAGTPRTAAWAKAARSALPAVLLAWPRVLRGALEETLRGVS